MYRGIAGTDECVRAIPGVRDRRVRATKVRLYNKGREAGVNNFLEGYHKLQVKGQTLYHSH